MPRPALAGGRLEITLETGRAARNVASARLHLGDFPQAVLARRGLGTVRSDGQSSGPPGLSVGRPE